MNAGESKSEGKKANADGLLPLNTPAKRALTVDESLQRTPITSVTPFHPEVIPLPQALPTTLCSPSLSSQDRATGRIQLHELDEEVKRSDPGKTSKKLEQTLKDLQLLLRREEHTEYHLQMPPIPSPLEHPDNAVTSLQDGRENRPPPNVKLGAFARSLSGSGKFASSFHYLTPHTRKTTPARRPRSSSPRQSRKNLDTPLSNQKAFAQNTKATLPNLPATPTSNPDVASAKSTPFKIVPPQPVNERDFVGDHEADEALLVQIKTAAAAKEDEKSAAAIEILRDVDIDQRERAQAALHRFQDMLTSIFEAEDSLGLDGSDSISTQQYFDLAPNDNGFILTDDALSRVDNAIAKAISSKQISHVSLDRLIRLQKLCTKVVSSAFDSNFVLPEDYSEDSLHQLLMTVDFAQLTMAASRLLLRTMIAGRQEKELYSEEAIAQLLSSFQQITDGLVVATAEIRRSTENGKSLSHEKTLITNIGKLALRCGRVMKLLGDLLISSELSEMSVTVIDSVSSRLIFAANGTTEKDSVIGLQKFESLRRSAMDTLARVFLRAPSQRRSILDEILSSLEKLPVGRQSARQFSIIDGKPIQLVSALIMQLIQTTATRVPERHRNRGSVIEELDSDESDSESSDDPSPSKRKSKSNEAATKSKFLNAQSSPEASELVTMCQPLLANVRQNASYVAQFLVGRALKSSKSSDEPYRNLLDIFTEDFISVLGNTDWPAAEFILQYLLQQLIGLAENEKRGAPAKNMALDLMGIMGSGIAEVKVHLDRYTSILIADEDPEIRHLAGISRAFLQGQDPDLALLSVQGPYRSVIDYLTSRSEDDIQLQNARSFHLLQWSQKLCTRAVSPATPARDDREPSVPDDISRNLSKWLINAMRDAGNIRSEATNVAPPTARISYLLIILQSTFCKAMTRISSILMQSMASPHATIRSRSLKSVIQLLEKDPSLLDQNLLIVKHIIRAANDQSTMVRDAALGLIGKCVALRPSTEPQFLDTLLTLASDSIIGIRKRSIKQLKDTYLRNRDDTVRVRVASAFLRRMNDEDDSVVDLGRQTLEEIWIDPYPAVNDGKISLSLQQDLNRHSAQLVLIAEQSDDVLQAFEPFFRSLLVSNHRNASNNQQVCKAIASAAFDGFIENDQTKTIDARANILALLSVLVRASPTLLSLEQLKMLGAYTKTLKSNSDLRLYKPVTQIFHAAVPRFHSTDREFLLQLQENMVRSLSLIPAHFSDLLDEVTNCLWALSLTLDNKAKLVNISQNILLQITQTKDQPPKLIKCITMAGYFGKAWNLDHLVQNFRSRFTWWQGDSIADLTVQILLPHAKSDSRVDVRRAALQSICLTCLSWPQNFLKKEVQTSLEEALRSGDQSIELAVIRGLRDFFKLGETQTKSTNPVDGTIPEAQSNENLGSSMISSDSDKAATLLAQHFFEEGDVQRLALHYTNDVALAATELICSTNRQGLVHPRQSGLVLVALETSPNKSIATAAYEEHLSLNSKHESILEKEYLKAVEQAFIYQKNTIQDTRGFVLADQASPKLKLFFEVLKSSTLATRKKLLPSLCKRLDVNHTKAESFELFESHYSFAKFVCENLALASYGRVDEILMVCSTLENIFTTTGNALSQHIEPIFNIEAPAPIPLERLAQLALSAMLLTLFWQTRTHLRSVTTNLPSYVGKADKRKTQDTSKPPVKSTNTPRLEESYLKLTQSVDITKMDEQAMRVQCSAFMDLLSVDHEAKIPTESDEFDENMTGRPLTPDGDEASIGTASLPPSGAYAKAGMKRRRSESHSVASTPNGKKRGRPKLNGRKSSLSRQVDEDVGGWD